MTDHREGGEMSDKPYTDTDVETVADVIADARMRGMATGGYSMARAVLDALAAAGRLLPEGTATVEQFAAQYLIDGEPAAPYQIPTTRQGAESMVRAHDREAALTPGWRGTAKVVRRHQHTTPWVEAPDPASPTG
ncbi:hypothetical protein ACFOOK_28200 [Micromonospora krabiensis]|nr:hypothetical protein [Micromonospora krabiensis]